MNLDIQYSMDNQHVVSIHFPQFMLAARLLARFFKRQTKSKLFSSFKKWLLEVSILHQLQSASTKLMQTRWQYLLILLHSKLRLFFFRRWLRKTQLVNKILSTFRRILTRSDTNRKKRCFYYWQHTFQIEAQGNQQTQIVPWRSIPVLFNSLCLKLHRKESQMITWISVYIRRKNATLFFQQWKNWVIYTKTERRTKRDGEIINALQSRQLLYQRKKHHFSMWKNKVEQCLTLKHLSTSIYISCLRVHFENWASHQCYSKNKLACFARVLRLISECNTKQAFKFWQKQTQRKSCQISLLYRYTKWKQSIAFHQWIAFVNNARLATKVILAIYKCTSFFIKQSQHRWKVCLFQVLKDTVNTRKKILGNSTIFSLHFTKLYTKTSLLCNFGIWRRYAISESKKLRCAIVYHSRVTMRAGGLRNAFFALKIFALQKQNRKTVHWCLSIIRDLTHCNSTVGKRKIVAKIYNEVRGVHYFHKFLCTFQVILCEIWSQRLQHAMIRICFNALKSSKNELIQLRSSYRVWKKKYILQRHLHSKWKKVDEIFWAYFVWDRFQKWKASIVPRKQFILPSLEAQVFQSTYLKMLLRSIVRKWLNLKLSKSWKSWIFHIHWLQVNEERFKKGRAICLFLEVLSRKNILIINNILRISFTRWFNVCASFLERDKKIFCAVSRWGSNLNRYAVIRAWNILKQWNFEGKTIDRFSDKLSRAHVTHNVLHFLEIKLKRKLYGAFYRLKWSAATLNFAKTVASSEVEVSPKYSSRKGDQGCIKLATIVLIRFMKQRKYMLLYYAWNRFKHFRVCNFRLESVLMVRCNFVLVKEYFRLWILWYIWKKRLRISLSSIKARKVPPIHRKLRNKI